MDQITWSRPKVYKSGPDYLVAVSWAEGWGSCGVWADLVRWMTAGAAVGAACAACAAVGIGPIGIAHGSHRSDRHRSRIASVRSASLARLCRQELRGDGCERFEAAHFLVRTSGHVRALAWGNWNRFVPG